MTGTPYDGDRWAVTGDAHGGERAVWYDPTARDCWMSVALVDGRVPDFGDPATWSALRRRDGRRRRSRRERRFRLK